jgi:hypothetical protein
MAVREIAIASIAGGRSNPSYDPQDEQQCDGTDGCAGNDRDKTVAEMDSEFRQHPAADKRSDDADNDVAKKTEPAALDDCARQHTGDCADHQPDDDGLKLWVENHEAVFLVSGLTGLACVGEAPWLFDLLDPLIDFEFDLLFGATVSRLDKTKKLGSLAVNGLDVVIGQFTPLRHDLAFVLLPVAFDLIPVHACFSC